MAQQNGDGGDVELDSEGYTRYKQESDNYQQSMADPGAYQSPMPYLSPHIQNALFYNSSQDPSLQLPPIKSVEGYAPVQSQYQPAHQSIIDTDPQQGVQYQPANQAHQYPPPPMDAFSSAHAHAMQHPLQPALLPGDRMMNNDKHRKEIKRRTKTGCLTCRKRRIKCDETHPICRNCSKSKRECAGYDPLFRSQGSPQSIHASVGADSSSRTTPIALTPEAVGYSTIPQGYTAAADFRYGHPSTMNYSPASSSGQNYEYQAAIDPALAGGEQTNMGTSGLSNVEGSARIKPESAAEHTSPYAPVKDAGPNNTGRKPTRIEDLYMIGGTDPPTPALTEPMSSELLAQVKYLYTNEYAKGVDHFLETTWYTNDGLDRLLGDTTSCEMFAGMLELFHTTKSDNYDAMRLLPLTESRVTWMLMCLVRGAASIAPSEANNFVNPSSNNPELIAVVDRLSIFEHLITGRILPSNPFATNTPPSYPNSTNTSDHLNRRHQFWRELGHHVTLNPSNHPEVDASLTRLRLLLDMIENRDVLYSMAIVRRYGGSGVNVTEEERGKLLVARKFIEDEAAGKGTTQVVQRLCGMAVRSWAELR